MAEEKILVFSLRKEALKTPKWRRSGDAASILRRKLAKFSKTGTVRIDSKTNDRLWQRGVKYPPMKLRLRVKKLDDGSVETELLG